MQAAPPLSSPAAAPAGVYPSVVIDGSKVHKEVLKNKDIARTTYAPGKQDSSSTAKSTITERTSGQCLRFETELNKLSELYFVPFTTSLTVPAQTTCTVKQTFHINGAKQITTKDRATSAASFQLLYFGEEAPSGTAITPRTEANKNYGASNGSMLFQGSRLGKSNKDNGDYNTDRKINLEGCGNTNTLTLVYKNTTGKEKTISYHFAFWGCTQRGSTYENRFLVEFTTSYEVTSTEQVILAPTGGTVSLTSKTVTYGDSYGSLPTPTRPGYTFDGWFTAKTGGEKITYASKVTTFGVHTLYAHWAWNGESSTTTTYEDISGEVPLWFGDTQLSYTDENDKVDIGGVKSVRYDATNGYTVTLCGYTYNAAPSYRHELELSCAVLYNGNVPLTIVLEGENTITPKKVTDYITGLVGILSTSDQTLTIEGDGTLNITIEPAAAAYGIYSDGELIVNGGVLNAVAEAYPRCDGDDWNNYLRYKLAIGIRAAFVTVNGGTVTAAGGLVDPHTGTTDSEREYHGIALGYTNSTLTVYGGTLVVKSLGASVVGYNYFALREDYATAPSGKIWATEDLDGKDPIEWPSEEEWQCSFSYMKFIGANSNG